MASIMSPLGYQYTSCGYCKSSDGSKKSSRPNYYGRSPGQQVEPLHYQNLANRGWRRAGTLYYKPDLKHACCPHYTIRLDSSQFKASRKQRKACNRFASWIIGNEYPRQAAKLCPKTRDEKRYRKQEFDVKQRIYEPEYDYMPKPIDLKTGKCIQPSRKLEVNLEPDSFTEEKYALFAQYQEKIHKESQSEISRNGFRRFLCSGMKRSTFVENSKERKIGSFHQCYRIDGRLVALGVLDLMPNCVSSVYLIYHHDFAHLEFGRVSALREIALAIEEGYRYYYMGYYIHSCAKMKYKRDFRPTYVSDPESYEWDLLDNSFLDKLDAQKYVSLARNRRLEGITCGADENVVKDEPDKSNNSLFKAQVPGMMTIEEVAEKVDLQDVKILYNQKIFTLKGNPWDPNDMKTPGSIQGVLAEFVACVGAENVKDWIAALE